MNVGKEIAVLKHLPATELRAKYAEVFGEETRSHHERHRTLFSRGAAADALNRLLHRRRQPGTDHLCIICDAQPTAGRQGMPGIP